MRADATAKNSALAGLQSVRRQRFCFGSATAPLTIVVISGLAENHLECLKKQGVRRWEN